MEAKPGRTRKRKRIKLDIERTTFPEGLHGVVLRILYSMLRLIARHFPGFWGALAAFFTVSFVVAVAAVSIFAGFAKLVHEGMTQSFDEAVLRHLESIRAPMLDKAMLEVTALGGGSVLIMIVVIASLFLWMTDHKWSVYLLITAVIGGQLINQALKLGFNRPRPSVVEMGQHVVTLSFPSGHAMTSIITYGSIAYLVGRLGPTHRLRWMVWIVAMILVCMIGFSRLYLGVHYPSDVIAGFFGGAAWLAFVAAGLRAVEFFSERRPETKHEEHDLGAEEQREAGTRT